jgi:aminoglycoside phosphotransferase
VRPEVFPAVERESPLYPRVEELRGLVAADPGLEVGDGATVRAELLPRRRSGGDVELRRFYWSVRRSTPQTPLGLTARTLYVDGRAGSGRTYDFPDEPVMDWLSRSDGPLYSHGGGSSLRVLRYIPLRRVTFLLCDAPGLPRRVIAKTKRASGLLRAARALEAAHGAVQRSGRHAFAVPRPVRLDVERRLLYLEELPGRPLDGELERLGVATAMSRLGAIHRELHELEVPGLGVRRCADWLSDAEQATRHVGVLVPSVARWLDDLYARLWRTAPGDGDFAFAQGDFVPSQILCDSGGWAVIDLDDGHYADPHAEVAALCTALVWELGLPSDQTQHAREVYVSAYSQRAGRPLDPGRWRWHLAVAELRYLARRTIKGRALPGEAQRVLEGIDGRSTSIQT